MNTTLSDRLRAHFLTRSTFQKRAGKRPLFDPQHLPKAGRQKAQFNSSVPSAEELVCTEKITLCEKKE